jgi:hypothetical protein
MRKIVLSAVCALGLGLAATAGASAAPVAGLSGAANYTAIQEAQYVVVRPGHRRVCRTVTVCRRGWHGRRICRTERVCRR